MRRKVEEQCAETTKARTVRLSHRGGRAAGQDVQLYLQPKRRAPGARPGDFCQQMASAVFPVVVAPILPKGRCAGASFQGLWNKEPRSDPLDVREK